MGLFIIFLWLSSVVAGYFHFFWWLILPIGFFVRHVVQATARMTRVARENGLKESHFAKNMVRPNLELVATAVVQHAALFALGWLLDYFIS